jgi:hypothetical protein
MGFPFRDLAASEGVVSPDRLIRLDAPPGPRHDRPPARRAIERMLFELPAGVTEICVRPAADSGELRSMAPDWAARVDDLDAMASNGEVAAMAQRAGAVTIGYRALRDLQRRAA